MSTLLTRILRTGRIMFTVIGLANATPLPCVPALAASDPVPAATVTVDNFSFTPATLTVKPGTTVTFVNHDDIPHQIVAVDKTFRSKALDTDDSFQFTFATAGDFDYFCGLHPHMKGKIIVAP
jgi:plastocyanin